MTEIKDKNLAERCDWSFPVPIAYGPGRLGDLGSRVAEMGVSNPLIVTDRGSAGLPFIGELQRTLAEADIHSRVFSDVAPNPLDSDIQVARRMFREGEHDAVIAIGGGSGMDAGKATALTAHNDVDIWQFDFDREAPTLADDHEFPPLICIPTTAGTGAETESTAMITHTERGMKLCVWHADLKPSLTLLDPMITVGLPANLTAWTGIDAMVHAIEAYTSKIKKNPVSDMLARQALTLLSANQRRVLSHPDDVVAREAMLLGATLAGQAFANAPVAAVHALAYPLGGHYHMPHGLSNALMLPAVLRFNAPAAEALYLELAPLLPEPVAPGLEGFVSWFEDLIADAALPTTLSAAEVPESDLPMLAADAMQQQRLLVNNPVEVDEAAALALYTAAWSGSA